MGSAALVTDSPPTYHANPGTRPAQVRLPGRLDAREGVTGRRSGAVLGRSSAGLRLDRSPVSHLPGDVGDPGGSAALVIRGYFGLRTRGANTDRFHRSSTSSAPGQERHFFPGSYARGRCPSSGGGLARGVASGDRADDLSPVEVEEA